MRASSLIAATAAAALALGALAKAAGAQDGPPPPHWLRLDCRVGLACAVPDAASCGGAVLRHAVLYLTLDPLESAGVLSVSFDGALETFYPLAEWPAPDQRPLEFEFLQQEGDPDARALLSLGGEPVLGLQGVEGRVMIDGMYWGMEGYCLPAAEATE